MKKLISRVIAISAFCLAVVSLSHAATKVIYDCTNAQEVKYQISTLSDGKTYLVMVTPGTFETGIVATNCSPEALIQSQTDLGVRFDNACTKGLNMNPIVQINDDLTGTVHPYIFADETYQALPAIGITCKKM